MKLEFLADGAPDCPLIRLFDFKNEEAARLKSILESLSNGSADNIALRELAGFEQINPCRIYLRAGTNGPWNPSGRARNL
jgi:hypothetical protein